MKCKICGKVEGFDGSFHTLYCSGCLKKKLEDIRMPRLLDKKEKYCGKCLFTTPHVYVRNSDTEYWRCDVCVEYALKNGEIFIPKYIEKSPRWQGFNKLDFNDQMNKFRKGRR